ncbi:MAG: hypothetical protein A2284_06225 [Deltaproteobacteria bacterium RIFOXYA12_FULL_61_11]|nr:MAG: hypothetical protein A2284_06225 [Deltaproteobacteria bacterium RIFOXYA12_FULL_61_11]
MASYFELLKRIEIFHHLSLIEINQLSAICEELEYSRDKLLVEEGGVSRGLCLLRSGTVSVRKLREGVDEELTTLGPGMSFGEMALVDDFPASATIRTSEEVTILFISKQNFLTFVSEKQDVGLKIYQSICRILSSRLRRANDLLAGNRPEDTTP